MKPEEIQQIIAHELHACIDWENLHGITLENIAEHLVKPFKEQFYNDFLGTTHEYWVVLNEIPNEPDLGYQIYYSENDKMFGLATTEAETERKSALGFYGTFIKTLSAM